MRTILPDSSHGLGPRTPVEQRQGVSVAPGDLVFVRYLDLDGGPTAAYQVIAVYDIEQGDVHQRFFYFHLGRMRIYDAPVSVLEESNLEVTVHCL